MLFMKDEEGMRSRTSFSLPRLMPDLKRFSMAVPILTYHSLDISGSPISTPPETFRRQMYALRDWGFQGIHLGRLLDAWEGTTDFPPRPVVLTFDDGFKSVRECAAPVLAELGFQATIFVVAGYCGGKNDWRDQPAHIPRLPLLDWVDIREMARAGLEVGSHGVTHSASARLGKRELLREVAGSKQMIEDHLGQPVTVFAYPYGQATQIQRDVVKAHYRAACCTELRLVKRQADHYWLPRVDMYYLRRAAFFRMFPSHMCRLYLGLRAFGREVRAALG
jgi:peptidoglycan/xylan/chitin deacetylase (PgdA/CDA1 family)